MKKTKFYETTITIKVLSDRDINELELSDVIEEATTGDCLLSITKRKMKPISNKTTVRKTYEYGSEPGFFNLKDNGEENF